jgi:hypothetical protein
MLPGNNAAAVPVDRQALQTPKPAHKGGGVAAPTSSQKPEESGEPARSESQPATEAEKRAGEFFAGPSQEIGPVEAPSPMPEAIAATPVVADAAPVPAIGSAAVATPAPGIGPAAEAPARSAAPALVQTADPARGKARCQCACGERTCAATCSTRASNCSGPGCGHAATLDTRAGGRSRRPG